MDEKTRAWAVFHLQEQVESVNQALVMLERFVAFIIILKFGWQTNRTWIKNRWKRAQERLPRRWKPGLTDHIWSVGELLTYPLVRRELA